MSDTQLDSDEWAAINEWLGSALDDSLFDVIEVAMNRCNVKKGRRPHVRRVVETAFKVALERAERDR